MGDGPSSLSVEQVLSLAIQYHQAGQLAEAEALYRVVVARDGNHVGAWYLLGAAAVQSGRAEVAVAAFREAVARNSSSAPGLNATGTALVELGRLDDAVEAFTKATKIDPTLADAHSNLGDVLRVTGRIEEAVAAYDRAVAVDPVFTRAASNRLFALQRHPDYDAAALHREHQCWNDRHARPLVKDWQPHLNPPAPERRLRVGYVAPHLLPNSVARFLMPLLSNHDRQQFDIVWYAGVEMPDDPGLALRSHVDEWKPVWNLSDEELTATVRADRIDLLVDLSMHIAGNRLLMFARKPAPVQITYLAYCGTTGLTAMDYRITDAFIDPPGQGDVDYSERSVRLPETFWCYPPNEPAIAVGPLPAATDGRVTFGCLNAFSKVSPPALALWGRLLQELAGSRLILHAPEGSHRDQARRRLSEIGIEPSGIEFTDLVPMNEYLGLYRRVDIALDPFPYAGGTTTCDALWMGVPVVSLVGRTAMARAGASILSNVGLGELLASSPDHYLAIASALARDVRRLAELRAGLRDRMQRSPLMDGPRFARNMEAAYRDMWRRWCDGHR